VTPGLELAPELRARVCLAAATLEGVDAAPRAGALAAEIEATCAELRARHAGTASGTVPGTEDARALYKAIGVDPTKTRPSSEALLRRVLRGDPFPEVNALVDALNLSSLVEQLSFGLYDLDRVEGERVALRMGAPGEGYEGIRKAWVGLEGRPALCDARGPFGNPTSDSARTCTGPGTRRALVVLFAPASAASRADGVLSRTIERIVRHCGGAETGRARLP
jgi:DNA/RNA-binding domain of Phe-tRNA-synthetase-like protein